MGEKGENGVFLVGFHVRIWVLGNALLLGLLLLGLLLWVLSLFGVLDFGFWLEFSICKPGY